MNLYEDGLSHLFGLNPRKKAFKHAVAWTLVIASVINPITFRHATWDFSQRRTAMVMKWFFDPAMKQINDNFAKQKQRAKQLQQQQQKVQSGH